jgi:hypothetical protein
LEDEEEDIRMVARRRRHRWMEGEEDIRMAVRKEKT